MFNPELDNNDLHQNNTEIESQDKDFQLLQAILEAHEAKKRAQAQMNRQFMPKGDMYYEANDPYLDNSRDGIADLIEQMGRDSMRY